MDVGKVVGFGIFGGGKCKEERCQANWRQWEGAMGLPSCQNGSILLRNMILNTSPKILTALLCTL